MATYVPSELSAALIADAPADGSVPIPTAVGGVPVSAAVEVQSTTRAFLLPRMTTAQRDAIVTPANGMMIYNTTTNSANAYEGGAWGASGGGDVDGPGAATDQGLSIFSGVTGKLIAATSVLLNPATSVISAIGGLFNAAGTAAVPTYSFTGDTDTGVYQSGANAIGFATAGIKQMVVSGAATTVNNLNIAGSATTAPVTITAEGTDATIPISLTPKNNGSVLVNAGSSAAPGVAFNGGATSIASGLFFNLGSPTTSVAGLSVAGNSKLSVNGNAIVSVGLTTADATLTNGIQLQAGTAPTGVANVLQIYGATVGVNVGTLGLRVPAGSVSVSAANTVNFKLQINVNGTDMYLLASNTP